VVNHCPRGGETGFTRNFEGPGLFFLTGGGARIGRGHGIAVCGIGRAIFVVAGREDPLREKCEERFTEAGGQPPTLLATLRDLIMELSIRGAKPRQQFGERNQHAESNNDAGNSGCATKNSLPNASKAVVGIVLNGSFNCTRFANAGFAQKRGGMC